MIPLRKRSSFKRRLVIAALSTGIAMALFSVFQAKMMESPSMRDLKKVSEYHDPAKPIQIKQGQEFAVALDSNPTTGYGWKLSAPLDKTQIVIIEIRHHQNKSKLLGSGGKDVWVFKTLREGTVTILFEYVRPWEKDTPPIKRSVFTVFIQK